VDIDGNIITQNNLEKFRDLVILIGDDAPQNAHEMILTLQAEPDIYQNIESMKFISGRRWDLVLKNETVVKLGEDNISLAISTLKNMHEENRILDKSLEFIDLRDLSKITVKTKLGKNLELSDTSRQENLI
ncbi:MAG: cell division protein FtsQ/DivIB, partial [Pseudomonadota bacterium]